jgi:hypothetical protein
VLVEPREPYKVKAGILELCSSFDANPGLFVSLDIVEVLISREIGAATLYISRRHLAESRS